MQHKTRKLEYCDQIIGNSKYQRLRIIIQGRVEGKLGPERRKASWLRSLRQWYGVSMRSLFSRAVDKVQIVLLIANVLGEHGT